MFKVKRASCRTIGDRETQCFLLNKTKGRFKKQNMAWPVLQTDEA
jgi:hypothetical protein